MCRFGTENNGAGLVLFNQDGSVDLSFGLDGKLVKSIYSAGSRMRGMANNEKGNALTFTPLSKRWKA